LANHDLSPRISDDEALSPEDRYLLEKLYATEDIVHDWDDWSTAGFALWAPILAAAFAPPEKDAA
jgi:hypothetical protein